MPKWAWVYTSFVGFLGIALGLYAAIFFTIATLLNRFTTWSEPWPWVWAAIPALIVQVICLWRARLARRLLPPVEVVPEGKNQLVLRRSSSWRALS